MIFILDDEGTYICEIKRKKLKLGKNFQFFYHDSFVNVKGINNELNFWNIYSIILGNLIQEQKLARGA